MATAPVAALVAAGISAAGSIYQAQGQAAMSRYQAKVAEQNAVLAQQQSAEQERRSRIEASKILGQARANYGASGVQMTGSPLDIMYESAANSELDALTIRQGGQVRASDFRSEARMQRASASNTLTAGYINAAGSLLKGYAQYDSMTPTPKEKT